MKILKLLVVITLVIAIVGCERQELFSIAQNGTPLIYATYSDAASSHLLVISANEEYKKNAIINSTANTSILKVHVDRRLRVSVLDDNKKVHVCNDSDIFSWNLDTLNANNIDSCISSIGDKTFLFDFSSVTDIYEYNPSSKTWSTITPVLLANSSSVYRLDNHIFVAHGNSSLGVTRFDGNSMIDLFSSIASISNSVSFISLYNQEFRFFVGTQFYYGIPPATLSQTTLPGAGNPSSYVQSKSGDIFYIDSGSPSILYKFNGSTFDLEKEIGLATISSSSMASYDEENIVIAIKDGSNPGLFLYNFITKEMKQLSSENITAVTVK